MGFTEHLRDRGAAGLAALLDLRRDLSAPPPASIRALAARAATRASLDRALARLDAAGLAVVDAVAVLPAPVHPADLGPALGCPPPVAAAALAEATELALVWADDGLHLAPGLAELLGPHPAGLGPPLAVTRPAGPAGSPTAEELAALLAAPDGLDLLLAGAPPAARRVLDALAWGPPVGRTATPGTPAHEAVTWLLARGLLAVGDPHHVLLPREVGLALRAGRVVATPPLRPTPDAVPVVAADAEAGAHALEVVRLVGALVAEWDRRPPPVLRAGGLGARELRRLASALDQPPATVAVLLEVAGAARLVADDGEEAPSFRPTTLADDWAALPPAHRWAALAEAWLTADRAPWLVGTRDEAGALRSALDPAHRRGWVAPLRTATLRELAAAGGRLTAAEVTALLAWRSPRQAPLAGTVAALLEEAALLGLTGAGALAGPARILLDGAADAPARAAVALDAAVPPPVDEVLLGGDLTGIVPGRPTDALAALLEQVADVESRGGGLTVRFTEASIRRALDLRGGEQVLADLAAHARGPVPQPLAYLVADAARRHGQVRTGAAGAYLRGDPAVLAGLPETAAGRSVGLRRLTADVLVARAEPAAVLAALRGAGVAVVIEDADGLVLRPAATTRRVRARPVPPPDPELTRRRVQRVAADLLAAGPGPGTPEPAETLGLLRAAAGTATEVHLDLAGPEGTERRRVRVLRVDGGRVRVLDPQREAELVVAVHRVVGASPVEDGDQAPDQDQDEGGQWTDR